MVENGSNSGSGGGPKVTRRWILWGLGGAGGLWGAALALYPVFKYLGHSVMGNVFGKDGRAKVDKITLDDVAQPGMGKNGAYGGRGLILFRNAAGELKAFDSKCTHAGCNAAFEKTRIYCNCHGGSYNLEGKNIAGPPPRPLTPLKVIVEKGILYVAPMDKPNA